MNKRWQDWINGLLGLWIIVSPWALEHTMPSDTGGLAMWNLWTVGVAVLVIAAIALFAFQAWEEWTNAILGVWLLVSPWLLGFSTSTALVWNAVIIGTLVAVFAGWALYEAQGPEPSAK
jgi:hypothetical protein